MSKYRHRAAPVEITRVTKQTNNTCSMLTILSKSVSPKKVKNFHTFQWRSSNNLSNTLTETFWIVRTPFRKFKFIEYLQLKNLMGLTNEVEVRCLIDAPGVLTDPLYIAALRAVKTVGVSRIFWERLRLLQRLLGVPEWSENLYYTYDGVCFYEIEEVRRSIRKVKKYSGYVRNSSSVGTKSSRTISRPEPEIFEWNNDVETDYYEFLTVGEFHSGPPGLILFTLMRTKSSKR